MLREAQWPAVLKAARLTHDKRQQTAVDAAAQRAQRLNREVKNRLVFFGGIEKAYSSNLLNTMFDAAMEINGDFYIDPIFSHGREEGQIIQTAISIVSDIKADNNFAFTTIAVDDKGNISFPSHSFSIPERKWRKDPEVLKVSLVRAILSPEFMSPGIQREIPRIHPLKTSTRDLSLRALHPTFEIKQLA